MEGDQEASVIAGSGGGEMSWAKVEEEARVSPRVHKGVHDFSAQPRIHRSCLGRGISGGNAPKVHGGLSRKSPRLACARKDALNKAHKKRIIGVVATALKPPLLRPSYIYIYIVWSQTNTCCEVAMICPEQSDMLKLPGFPM